MLIEDAIKDMEILLGTKGLADSGEWISLRMLTKYHLLNEEALQREWYELKMKRFKGD